MSQVSFLIGRGELLTHDIRSPKRGAGDKKEAYTFVEAVNRLTPEIEETILTLNSLEAAACPKDLAVACFTLNPSYIAKSYFPSAMLRELSLESIGSRSVRIVPEKWTKKKVPSECMTTELFIAGERRNFRNIQHWLNGIAEGSSGALDFAHIEKISTHSNQDRFRNYGTHDNNFYEVGIHVPSTGEDFILLSFSRYAQELNIKVHDNLRLTAGSLHFVPIEGEAAAIQKLSRFSFVRVIRPMPKLRGARPLPRGMGMNINCKLPIEHPISSDPRVVILDGGLPDIHPIGQWLTNYHLGDDSALDDQDYVEHGLAVTSAFLFGSILPDGIAPRPYSYIDHIRVLDKNSASDDSLELYRALNQIEEVLLSRNYEFINLSLGPNMPIEDAEVHAWTSVIDGYLSDGKTFMTVAIGNNGEQDHESGVARVQVPSDCVNAVAVGATNHTDAGWERARYSAIGPGRSPGVIKPDLMAFGGGTGKYFHALIPSITPKLTPLNGTSFAAPNLLRSAVGIRAILGRELTTLAIKALLIHCADRVEHDKLHVGWGKIPEDITQIITCQPGVARVVYQGELKSSKYLRAVLPLPADALKGKVRLKATFCYASQVDPQDAASYTKAGLDVVFRPHDEKIEAGKSSPKSKSFFGLKEYSNEEEQRSDMGKWETVLHDEVTMLGSSLKNPTFDIHYNAREAGGITKNHERIPYALIITIEALKHADLYNEILQAYRALVPIQPQVPIPIRV